MRPFDAIRWLDIRTKRKVIKDVHVFFIVVWPFFEKVSFKNGLKSRIILKQWKNRKRVEKSGRYIEVYFLFSLFDFRCRRESYLNWQAYTFDSTIDVASSYINMGF